MRNPFPLPTRLTLTTIVQSLHQQCNTAWSSDMTIEPRRYWQRIAGIPVVDPSVQQRADISSHNDSEQWQKINDAAMR